MKQSNAKKQMYLIEVYCIGCCYNHSFEVYEDMIGNVSICPSCQKVLRINNKYPIKKN